MQKNKRLLELLEQRRSFTSAKSIMVYKRLSDQEKKKVDGLYYDCIQELAAEYQKEQAKIRGWKLHPSLVRELESLTKQAKSAVVSEPQLPII